MNDNKKRWVWVLAAVAGLVVILASLCYPFLGARHQYYSLCRTIKSGDEDTAVRQVQALSESGSFAPDWTPGRAIIEFRNRWHLPNLSFSKYVDAGHIDSNYVPLLQQAAAHGQAKLTKALLAAGAAPDFYGDKGFRVLINGVSGGNTNVLAALIGQGADPNATYTFGTPVPRIPLIHVICMYNFAKPEVVEFLIRAGADPNIEIGTGDTALDLATTYKHTNYVSVLTVNGAVAGRQMTTSPP